MRARRQSLLEILAREFGKVLPHPRRDDFLLTTVYSTPTVSRRHARGAGVTFCYDATGRTLLSWTAGQSFRDRLIEHATEIGMRAEIRAGERQTVRL